MSSPSLIPSSNLNAEAKEFVPRPSSQFLTPDVLRSTLVDSVRKQIEFYFSDQNLPYDNFMLEKIYYNDQTGQGFFPFQNLCTFPRVSKLSHDVSIIRDSILTSSLLEFNSNGTGVRRRDWGYYLNQSSKINFPTKTRKNSKSLKSPSPNLNVEGGVKKEKKEKLKSKANLSKELELTTTAVPKFLHLIKEKESFIAIRQPKGPDSKSNGFSLEYRNSRKKSLESC